MIWTRRPPFGDENDINWYDGMHITLARLDGGQYLSITVEGDIHVWPVDSDPPDWNVWIPLKKDT